jgi:hypothetical protein
MPSSEDCATLKAHADGVDNTARAMEEKWGMDRLPLLVSDDTRAKFYRQKVKWYDALEAAWSTDRLTGPQMADAIAKCASMTRAWLALDAEASQKPVQPLSAEVWEVRLQDGTIAALCRSTASAGHVISEGRYVAVYTADEIANVLDALPGSILKAKEIWPGAKIQKSKNPMPVGGDPIPF